MGVPIFQEQVMQIAVVAAGFTPGDADQLRRSMAAWKRKGGVDKYRVKLVGGLLAHGYTLEFAEALFRQVEGFGEYGFPESHAASFALLAYASSWLKRHEPEAFLAALLNSQPMGFYPPAEVYKRQTLGPGATNLVTGLAEAYNAGTAMVALVGDSHRMHSWKNMTQEARQLEVLRPVVKDVLRVEKIERIPELVRRAFAVATSGRPGPVVLDVPEDIAHEVDVYKRQALGRGAAGAQEDPRP